MPRVSLPTWSCQRPERDHWQTGSLGSLAAEAAPPNSSLAHRGFEEQHAGRERLRLEQGTIFSFVDKPYGDRRISELIRHVRHSTWLQIRKSSVAGTNSAKTSGTRDSLSSPAAAVNCVSAELHAARTSSLAHP